MNLDNFKDGGQLLITSTIDDQSCFQLISEVLGGYPDVKNVELVDDYYKIDMSSWMTKKTIICWISYNGQRKFLQFGYKDSDKISSFMVLLVFFVLIAYYLSFFLALLIIALPKSVIDIVGYRRLKGRCEQYIRDVNNVLMLNEPTNNYKASTTESSDVSIKCPSCGVPVHVDMKFCPTCGKEIPSKRFCSHCGTEMNPNMNFCPKCGNKYNY